EIVLREEKSEQEAFSWQMSQLAALEPVLNEYLEEAPRHLCAALQTANAGEERDLLWALADLRAETAPTVLPLLVKGRLFHADLAVKTLTWSHDPEVGPRLRAWVSGRVPRGRRRALRRFARPPRRSSVPADIPFPAILKALRGHPSSETEALLVTASGDW